MEFDGGLPGRGTATRLEGKSDMESVTSILGPVVETDPATSPGRIWYVAHTRSRCEKKVVDFCDRNEIETTLPQYRSVRKYRGKTVTFEKPLFPGYVFLRMETSQRAKVAQNDMVANVLDVPVQDEFEAQLSAVMQAVSTEYEVRMAPTIQAGARVRIRSGPLRGLEGYVEERRGLVEVHLRLDFIAQAAAVRMEADMLELV